MRGEPGWVDLGAHLPFAAKDLERIGHRITNVAEEVVPIDRPGRGPLLRTQRIAESMTWLDVR